MVAVSEIVNNIEHKVQLLVKKLEVLERQNADLTEKNQTLVEQNRTLQADLLLKNSEISHLSKQIVSPDGVEESKEARERKHHLRKEIDQYIHEIDQCIEWLQKS